MSEAQKSGRNLTAPVNSRVVLMAGFGGLLMLTALAGADVSAQAYGCSTMSPAGTLTAVAI